MNHVLCPSWSSFHPSLLTSCFNSISLLPCLVYPYIYKLGSLYFGVSQFIPDHLSHLSPGTDYIVLVSLPKWGFSRSVFTWIQSQDNPTRLPACHTSLMYQFLFSPRPFLVNAVNVYPSWTWCGYSHNLLWLPFLTWLQLLEIPLIQHPLHPPSPPPPAS